MRHFSVSGSLALLLTVAAGPVGSAQQPPEWDASRTLMSRAALQDLLGRLEASAGSPAYSNAIRAHARAEAAVVRARLADGDLRTGDRIYLRVDAEPTLTDTFTVGAGRILTLPIVGDVPLTGVLHSELESHLREVIGRYVRDPTVHARSLIRLAVLGEVNKPGFYIFSTQTLVTDVLMVAGGPTRDAKTGGVRITRGGDPIWEGQPLQQAMSDGKTLDQLSLTAGDEVDVPRRTGGIFAYNTVTVLTAILAVPGTIYGLIRLFKN